MYHSGNQMIDSYELFKKVQLRPGMHVADLGCGQTGHIVFPVAKLLGETGIIYAVDILKDVLEAIKKRAASNSFLNVHTIWSDIEREGGTHIPAKSLDVAFLVNTLVQTKDRLSVLEEACRLLKDKARLVVVDWHKKGLTFGPPDDHYIDFEEIKKWAKEKGMVIQEEFAMGQFHRGVVLYKHD